MKLLNCRSLRKLLLKSVRIVGLHIRIRIRVQLIYMFLLWHISKRLVLDLPVSSSLGILDSGIIKDLAGKGGKLPNSKACSDSGRI